MKTIRVFSLVPALLLAAAMHAHAAAPTQFVTGAGEVRDFVAVSATTGYAATIGGGLWKSTNSGANWSKVTSLPATRVWKITANPNSAGGRLYAATDQGLFRSTDSGATWTQLSLDSATAVAVSWGGGAGGPDTILVGVPGVGVLRSTDSGNTLVRQSSGLDSTDFAGIVFNPASSAAYIALRCNYATVPNFHGQYGGVYVTPDVTLGTITWSPFNNGLPLPTGSSKPCVNAIGTNTNAANPHIVVGTKDPNTGGGTTYYINGTHPNWTQSIQFGATGLPFGVEWLGPDFSNNMGLFMGSLQFGPYRSTDGGVNFATLVDANSDPDMPAQSFAAGAFTSSIFVSNVYGYGLQRTTNGGTSWDFPAGPIHADRVNDLANHNNVAPSTYYLALYNGGVKKSVNAGGIWTTFNQGLQFDYNNSHLIVPRFIRNVETFAAHPSNENIAALSIRSFGLYTFDLGTLQWSRVTSGNSGVGYANPVDHKPQSLVITPAGKVFYSLFDAGATTPGGLHSGASVTTMATAGIPPGAGAYRVRESPTAPHIRVFLMHRGDVAYRTMDGGTTWHQVQTSYTGFSGIHFLDIAEKAAAPLTLVASTSVGIYRSVDDGLTWNEVVTSGLPQTNLAGLAYFGLTGTLFGGGFNGQLYCSTNDGTTWQAVTGGNLGAPIKAVKYMNGAIHVLTDGAGFWKKDSVCP